MFSSLSFDFGPAGLLFRQMFFAAGPEGDNTNFTLVIIVIGQQRARATIPLTRSEVENSQLTSVISGTIDEPHFFCPKTKDTYSVGQAFKTNITIYIYLCFIKKKRCLSKYPLAENCCEPPWKGCTM